VYQPLPHDDPVQRKPDIGLARRALGWEPRVRLRDGLKRTIAYFAALREELDATEGGANG
jgi:nucleoside-diphosphate-sugar epimerase